MRLKATAALILACLLGPLQVAQASRRVSSSTMTDQSGYAQVGGPEQGRSESQCEKISVPLCTQMPYLTRMPNFFEDSSQNEAAERAQFYQSFDNIKRCSPHLHTYLCEIITPVCIEKSPVTRIFPCRSFCRDIRRDCEDEIGRGSLKLQEAFLCENLPYEFNGGNGTEGYGPCHETPGHQAARTDHSGYRPYNEEQDTNVPPFITDTSRIESSLIKPMPPRIGLDPPPSMVGGGQTPQQSTPRATLSQPSQQSWWYQIQSSLQVMAFNLTKYSNILSIITVLCLLLALNSKRLRRLSWRLRGMSPSSSSASSTSGRHLQKSSHPGAGGGSSPSSSSRSLVLFAGTGKQPPTHHLLGPEEPQKLIHGLNQKTLVNVNTTLDRQANDRYLLLTGNHVRAPDKQQLFGTLDSQSSSNQYDYIQIDTPAQRLRQQQQQQQQMYSNILLTSPSHQVLLMQQQQQQTHIVPPPLHPPPPPKSDTPGSRHTHLPGYPSPVSGYADPLNQRSFQRRARTSSSRSTRLFASGSSVSSGSSSGVEQRPPRMPL